MTAKQFVDIICPDHDRTSCSDSNLGNGYGATSNDMPRCARCGLLEIIEKGELPVKGRIVVCFYPED